MSFISDFINFLKVWYSPQLTIIYHSFDWPSKLLKIRADKSSLSCLQPQPIVLVRAVVSMSNSHRRPWNRSCRKFIVGHSISLYCSVPSRWGPGCPVGLKSPTHPAFHPFWSENTRSNAWRSTRRPLRNLDDRWGINIVYSRLAIFLSFLNLRCPSYAGLPAIFRPNSRSPVSDR